MKNILWNLFVIFLMLDPIFGEDTASMQLVQSFPLETTFSLPSGVLDTQKVWVEMVQKARKTIDVEQFYLMNRTESGMEAVVQEMEKAGRRGVKIRMLVDILEIGYDPFTLKRLENIPGLEFRVMPMSKMTGGIQHAKYWIIDDETAFVGSQNFDWRSLEHIHEVGLLIRNKAFVNKLQELFNYDWRLAGMTLPPLVEPLKGRSTAKSFSLPQNENDIELVASPPALLPKDIPSSEEALLALIKSAKKAIRIQIQKYTPIEIYTSDKKPIYWTSFDDALREAALLRGVNIELMVSDWNVASLHNLGALRSLAMVPGISVKIVSIPQYSKEHIDQARLIHGKYLIVDNRFFWLGSSNMTENYFYRSRNVEVVGKDPKIIQELDDTFKMLWNSRYAKNVLQVTEATHFLKKGTNVPSERLGAPEEALPSLFPVELR